MIQQIQKQTGDDGLLINETKEQFLYAKYVVYCELKAIQYTDEEIVKQLYCSIEDLTILKSTFE